MPVTQITNHLAAVRRAFRAAALAHLRELTASDEEFRAEARDLFGVDMRMTWLSDRAIRPPAGACAMWPDLEGTRYTALDEIGRGGMGTVYRARDEVLDRDVALKVINAAGRARGAAPHACEQEARVLASLEHPGIVPVHDAGTLPDGRAFYVMKLVRGASLADHLAQRRALDDA